MGTEAIKLITGIGEPLLGRLMVYDALDMTYRTIKIRKDPATPKITELIDYEEFCGVVSEEAAEAAAGSTITPRELRELLDSGKPLALIDVREPVEWDINRIEGAELIPKSAFESGEALAELPSTSTPVLYCKTGVRSAEVLAVVEEGRFLRRDAPAGRDRGVGQATRTRHGDVLDRTLCWSRCSSGLRLDVRDAVTDRAAGSCAERRSACGAAPVPLGSSWEGGWRCGEVVLSMVADHARAAWSAKVRETLFVDGVRLARPVRVHRRPLCGRPAGAPTPSSRAPRNPAMTRWFRPRCGCTRRRRNWSGPAS